MKLYDLKLKEIAVLEKKIKEEKNNLSAHPKGKKPTKKQKLKRKLVAQKKHVAKTVKKVVSHHDKLVKVVEVYNKKFAHKNKRNIKDILTQVTLQLKVHMKNPHFKEAYKQFMVLFIKKVQTLTPDQLKKPLETARMMIANYFNHILADITAKAKKKALFKKHPPLPKKKPVQGKHH
jgi:hypothetical protein